MIPDYYSNAARISTGLHDVVLEFHLATPAPQVAVDETESNAESEILCRVRLSQQHAKAIAAYLVHQLLEYERNYEIEIPVRDDAKAIWNSIIAKEK